MSPFGLDLSDFFHLFWNVWNMKITFDTLLVLWKWTDPTKIWVKIMGLDRPLPNSPEKVVDDGRWWTMLIWTMVDDAMSTFLCVHSFRPLSSKFPSSTIVQISIVYLRPNFCCHHSNFYRPPSFKFTIVHISIVYHRPNLLSSTIVQI